MIFDREFSGMEFKIEYIVFDLESLNKKIGIILLSGKSNKNPMIAKIILKLKFVHFKKAVA